MEQATFESAYENITGRGNIHTPLQYIYHSSFRSIFITSVLTNTSELSRFIDDRTKNLQYV